MSLMINLDVPDLRNALAFYTQAFGLTLRRYLGDQIAELAGWPVAVFLLQKEGGSIGQATAPARTSGIGLIHLDIVVDDIGEAVARAAGAGAIVEQDVRTAAWGKIAALADPFGHGFCLVEFVGRGYDEIAEPAPPSA